jgi:hypothetical protein
MGLPVAVAAALYGFELRGRGLLYTGFDDGFLDVTVRSLVRYQLGVESAAVAVVVTVIGAGASLWLLFDWLRDGGRWDAPADGCCPAAAQRHRVAAAQSGLRDELPREPGRALLHPAILAHGGRCVGQCGRSEDPRAAWLALPFLFFPLFI